MYGSLWMYYVITVMVLICKDQFPFTILSLEDTFFQMLNWYC